MPEPVEAFGPGRRDPFAGRLLAGRYLLLDRIGSGAMGFVYRARDERDGGVAAVKVLRPELLGDWSLAKRFGREARAAQAIESPHVVRIFAWGDGGEDVLFIAMELLDGESLGTRLARGRLAPAEAVRIARGVASAIAAAHGVGVVHRDLKPDNVVLGTSGDVKVVDFGIARIVEGSRAASEMASHLTIAGSLMGTPLYMSPEGAARKPVGPPADLYALGVMLYEMLTGEPPFVHEDLVRLMGMHLRVRPQRLGEAAPELEPPESLEALVAALLRKDPEERPSAAEATQRLDAILPLLDGGEPAGPDTLPEAQVPAESIAPTLIHPPGPVDHATTPPTETRPTAEDAGDTVIEPPLAEPSRAAIWIALGGALALVALGALLAIAMHANGETDRPETSNPPARVPEPTVSAPREADPTREPPASPGETQGDDRSIGWLTVRADAACVVVVDGVRVGRIPVVDHPLPPGPHEVRCVSGDRRSARARIAIAAGETTLHRFRLRRRRAPEPEARELDIAREYR